MKSTIKHKIAPVSVSIDHIIRQHNPSIRDLASSRMIRLAAQLPPGHFLGWQMQVPQTGLARMEIFGSSAVGESDLRWAFEKMAGFSEASPGLDSDFSYIYEISLEENRADFTHTIGFLPSSERQESSSSKKLPLSYLPQFTEVVSALRDSGGIFRFTATSATSTEKSRCQKEVFSEWHSYRTDPEQYLGTPIKVKSMFALPHPASIRLRAAVNAAVSGASLTLLSSPGNENHIFFSDPSAGMHTVPELAGRMLCLEPFVEDEIVMGIHCKEADMPPIPATHTDNLEEPHIIIGKALDSSRELREIRLSDTDLRRHWQIIGQTGTGKSTLLGGSILSAIEHGYGLTFFDPHGSTINTVLEGLSPDYIKRVRVVRLGDVLNPVPLTVWSSNSPEREERTISDLNLLFADIFDPNHQGFVGPRWERWFSTFASAAIAIFGRQGSFAAITLLSQNRTNMRKAYDIIRNRYPVLANTIQDEFGKLSDSEFHDLIGWAVCKMQRLTSIPQLRSTLGAGANALDFDILLNSQMVTLIDLGSPIIGTQAARTIGTLLLSQLWNAVLRRTDRSRTHLVFIDEAHLFQTNPLPQMLAESRKFGLGLILAHQHCSQLTPEILEALEANSASFSAFRLSTKDAWRAATRLGNDAFQRNLCHLNAYNAVTTVSVRGLQSAPFTLMTDPVPVTDEKNTVIRDVVDLSLDELVNPYRKYKALAMDELQHILDSKWKQTK